MDPLIGLSILAGGLWIMAAQYTNAANRGMPVEPRFSSGAPITLKGYGAAYRIRTDDPLITNEMLYRLS